MDILKGNIYKGLIKLALPLMLFSLMNTLYNVVDTYWVAKIGELQVGAVSLIGPVMECGNAFAQGLSVAGVALISREIGKGRKDHAVNYASHLMYICITLGIVIGIVMMLFSHPILHFLSTPSDIYQDSYRYLLGISLDFLFLFVLTIFSSIRIASGDSATGVKVNMLSSVFNCILDPIMIFGFHLGTFGVAMATTLSKALVMPICFYILLKNKDIRKTKLEFHFLKRIVQVGLPASFGSFLSSFGFVLMNKSIVGYGSIVLSAYGLGNKISGLFGIPTSGIGSALATFVGQNLGANNIKRVKESYNKAMILAIVISVVFTSTGWASLKYIIHLFIAHPSKELYQYTYEYSFYSIGTMIFMAWYANLSGLFNGSGQTKYTFLLGTVRLWGVRIPLIYLFSHFTSLGPTGIWYAMCLSNVVTCLLGAVCKRKTIKQFTLQ